MRAVRHSSRTTLIRILLGSAVLLQSIFPITGLSAAAALGWAQTPSVLPAANPTQIPSKPSTTSPVEPRPSRLVNTRTASARPHGSSSAPQTTAAGGAVYLATFGAVARSRDFYTASPH